MTSSFLAASIPSQVSPQLSRSLLIGAAVFGLSACSTVGNVISTTVNVAGSVVSTAVSVAGTAASATISTTAAATNAAVTMGSTVGSAAVNVGGKVVGKVIDAASSAPAIQAVPVPAAQ